MNITKKLLVIALASILATPALYAARTTDSAANTGTTDDADDIHTVNITVPEIALLDVSNTDLTITVPETAVTDAGQGFGTYSADEAVTYALSSNVASAGGTTNTERTLEVSLTSGSLPAGAKFTVESTGMGATELGDTITHESSPPDLPSDGTSVTLASAIKNVTLTGSQLTYTLEPTDPNGMMSFTGTDGTAAETITLTYTLSEDS